MNYTRFRFWRRKAWGFKSLHPHQIEIEDHELKGVAGEAVRAVGLACG